MFGTLRSDAAQLAALARIQTWVQERFSLPAEAAVLVAELACTLPGCPPLETVIAFWTGADVRHHYKVFKPAQQVLPDDLPPYWMKDALAVPPDWACGCC
jgi:nitrate reductase delta subunit